MCETLTVLGDALIIVLEWQLACFDIPNKIRCDKTAPFPLFV